jgi:hypothetical protein
MFYRRNMPLMRTLNPFLTGSGESKGGGGYLEDPSSVENIAGQTAARPPDSFESRLADALMAVFADGVWELNRVVMELNARGCRDNNGSEWTAAAFQVQLAQSAARLFAPEEAPQDD